MWDTEQGKLCQADKFINAVRKFNFDIQRKNKVLLARKDAVSDMNTLASVFPVFQDLTAKQMKTMTVFPKDLLNHRYSDKG